ncbi:hypothetical protein AAHA92_21643 [Salvia divinorum]|uniref:Uncharacterized protein n=1 Tax=Salvia divinorum TaxID=28513 RepID=A0ABD1GL34_SALDI
MAFRYPVGSDGVGLEVKQHPRVRRSHSDQRWNLLRLKRRVLGGCPMNEGDARPWRGNGETERWRLGEEDGQQLLRNGSMALEDG